MSTSKADYLKRYMDDSPAVEDAAKKKKKKKKKYVKTATGEIIKVKERKETVIHDDDVGWAPVVDEDEDVENGIIDGSKAMSDAYTDKATVYNPEEIIREEAAPSFRGKKTFQSVGDDSPPRRRQRHDSDDDNNDDNNDNNTTNSPPRRRQRHDSDDDNDNDDSPPRRRQRHDSDDDDNNNTTNSPPRRRQRHDSDDDDDAGDTSPPRRRQHGSNDDDDDAGDTSPPRRRQHGTDDDNASPPRRRQHGFDDDNASPPRRRQDDDNASPPRRKEVVAAVEGGLVSAKVLAQQAKEKKEKLNAQFAKMGADSGIGAETTMRDKSGKRLDPKLEKLKKRQEDMKKMEAEERRLRWGGETTQSNKAAKMEEDARTMSKAFARGADDEDLNEFQKNQLHKDDPMYEYMLKQVEKKDRAAGKKVVPKYKGSWKPNRYNIAPGYLWDGVNRSNGFEDKWFKVSNQGKANAAAAYKWSSEAL